MCLFEKAIEQARISKTVKVYAPTGFWAISDIKDQWLAEVAKLGSNAWFVIGLSPDEQHSKLVTHRKQLLIDAGVNVKEKNPQSIFNLGFMIFDKIVFMGMEQTTPDRLEYLVFKKESQVKTFNEWYGSNYNLL